MDADAFRHSTRGGKWFEYDHDMNHMLWPLQSPHLNSAEHLKGDFGPVC